jgi:hypothetical protein
MHLPAGTYYATAHATGFVQSLQNLKELALNDRDTIANFDCCVITA